MNDVPAILDSLRHAPVILREFTAGIPVANLERRRCPECWTIAEHVLHLAQVQPMLYERLRRIIDEEQAVFIPFIPGEDESTAPAVATDLNEALKIFSEQRLLQVKMLESSAPEIWRKSAIHPEYEQYGLYILARHILMHDHWHMFRMEELWLTKDAYFMSSPEA